MLFLYIARHLLAAPVVVVLYTYFLFPFNPVYFPSSRAIYIYIYTVFMDTLGDVSSEEEDMFVLNKGASAVSFYSQPTTQKESAEVVDDDDDDLELPSLAPKSKRKRGRARTVTSAETITLDSDSDHDANKVTPTKPSSVFTSDPEVVDVDLDCGTGIGVDEVNTAVSKTQIETARLLQKAKYERQRNISLEAQLEKEATMEAKHQALILDRQQEMARKKELEEKAMAERAAKAARAAAERTSPVKVKDKNIDTPVSAGTEDGDGATIVLRVRHGAKVVKMKILQAEPLLRMLQPFCEKIGVDVAKAVMEVDGVEVEENDTSQTYELEDNNIVEVRLRK